MLLVASYVVYVASHMSLIINFLSRNIDWNIRPLVTVNDIVDECPDAPELTTASNSSQLCAVESTTPALHPFAGLVPIPSAQKLFDRASRWDPTVTADGEHLLPGMVESAFLTEFADPKFQEMFALLGSGSYRQLPSPRVHCRNQSRPLAPLSRCNRLVRRVCTKRLRPA